MYENLAKFYDTFMQDVPYGQWTDFVVTFLAGKKSGMDVGCGSGLFTIELLKRGFDVSGCDLSPEMLSKAYENAQKAKVKGVFSLQSAVSFKAIKPLDFITACCDVVNYISSPKAFFKTAYKNLNDGGVLVFDISSEYKLKKILGNNIFTEENDEVTYIWENVLSRNKVDLSLTFFEKEESGLYRKSVEEQTQYIHSEENIKKWLSEVGFTKVESYDAITGKAPDKKAERIHFVAIKEVDNG